MVFRLILCLIAFNLGRILASIPEGAKCEQATPCEKCEEQQMHKEFCQDTGKRAQWQCWINGEEKLEYRSCNELTSEGSLTAFVSFQVTMAIVGLGAFHLAKARKISQMTSYGYDYRRLNQNNGSK